MVTHQQDQLIINHYNEQVWFTKDGKDHEHGLQTMKLKQSGKAFQETQTLTYCSSFRHNKQYINEQRVSETTQVACGGW